jgi:endonuclease/exonuclease/phosphatase family metal-dependent hydrolase
MRILNYNLWHGLAPQGRIRFRALEPEFRLRQREELQRELIGRLNPDVICFQETNPIDTRAEEFKRLTGKAAFIQPDSVGVKIQGKGWPPRLNSGLVTLLPPGWGPRKICGLKLSGPKWSVESPLFSLQWSESRYAILVEFLHKDWGRTLVVNAHLHHGLELNSQMKARIQEMTDQGLLSPTAAGELKDRIQVANERRQGELKTLTAHLERIRNRYSLILAAGDFNFTAESQAYASMRELGFRDLWFEAGHTDEQGYSYDGELNWGNHVFTREFPIPLEFDDLTFSPKTRQLIGDAVKAHEWRRRRIDFIFAYSAGRPLKVTSAELVGVPARDELGPSDHFGVLVNLE